MNINQTAIKKLLRINWLSNAGKDSSIPNTTRVKNINAFQLNLESEEWENVTLEARNNITGWLAKKHVNAFLEWNKLADAAIIIESKVVPQIPLIEGNQEVLLSNIKWDLLNYLLEDAYSPLLNKPLFL
ncbi:hypothetical protein NNQ28_01115 [Cronobacter dublinensis]|uniref:hypothetical protein n=1 Tax=Cronobacter dublinensis TaxID=413497 RepID=UPI00292F4C19|nr:hypothetical protein [Cronobacter dublinensis]WNY83046.1 hypothetical protein NNQ28_01115 [Cronobacter dublinensis]